MNKIEAKDTIYKVFDYIDNGVIKTDFGDFAGHPGLYFFHTKKEFETMLDSYLNKEFYSRYDIYYMIERLVKFLLGKYDSHTKAYFKDNIYFPIAFKIQNDEFYIINIIDNFKDIIGGKIISINNIPIERIASELEQIINYSTVEYKNLMLANNIKQLYILKSLPSIEENVDKITYEIEHNQRITTVEFDVKTKYENLKSTTPENYSYEILDDILIIHYNSCKNIDKMKSLIEKLKIIENKINYYIIDIRNNSGGFSSINHLLIDFLYDKKIVTIVNEDVFSSGRMMLVDLKKLGSYVIGTNISTSLNAFGNVPSEYELENLGLIIKRSNNYWYYDDNLELKYFTKENFSSYFKNRRELLVPKIIKPDKYVCNTVDDIISNKDTQLESAINYVKNIKKID